MNDEHLEAWIADLPAEYREMARTIQRNWEMGALDEAAGAYPSDLERFTAILTRLRGCGMPDYPGNPEIREQLATLSRKVRRDAEEFLRNWETAHFLGAITADDRALQLQALRSWIKNPEDD